MNKKLLKKFFLTVLLTFSFIFIIVFSIDPLQHYRKASFYNPLYINSNYLIPGLLKNHEWNSILLGSSMTKNFFLSDMQTLNGFENPIKLSLSGAMSKNIKIIADTAFQEKSIDSVLFGLDIFSLAEEVSQVENEQNSIPLYLYDNNVFNDFKYIYNIDTLFESIRPFIYRYTIGEDAKVFNKNIMFYSNVSTSIYNESIPISNYFSYKDKLLKNKNIDKYAYSNLTTSFDNNVLPIVQDNPNTKFIFFYPPYSILAYKLIDDTGWLENYLKVKIYIYEKLAKHSNVVIYDFQTEKEVTHNLSNYRDYSHYSYKINKWIIQQIKANNYQVKANNLENSVITLRKQVLNYKIPIIADN